MADDLKSDTGIRNRITPLLAILVLLGFWLRVRNLGALGLELDEGHQALAVRGILEQGLPTVPSGYVYLRGWPFLYLEAGAAAIFGLDEFALRLPAVVFGTASIAMIYLLGARVFSRETGLAAALIFTLSIWEIEFARYARMYTMFQLLYMIALYNFYRGFIEGDRRHRLIMPWTAALAISLHDLGVMLAVLFLIPFLLRRYAVVRPRVLMLNAVWIGVFWVVYRKLLRLLGAQKPELTGAMESAPGSLFEAVRDIIRSEFSLPPIGLIRELAQHSPVSLVFLVLILGIGLARLGRCFWRAGEKPPYLLMAAMLLALGIHQFGLAILAGLALLFLYWDLLPAMGRGSLIAWGAACGALLLLWLGLATDARLAAAGLDRAEAFFSYPSFYRYFLRWYWEGWPRLTILIVAGLGLMAYKRARGKGGDAYTFVAAALLIPAVGTGFLRVEVYEARYTFHLFPLVVLIGAYLFVEISRFLWNSAQRRVPESAGLASWSRPGVAVIIVLLSLLITQDIDPVEAYSVGGRSYLRPRNEVKAHINWNQYSYFHQDHRTPALFVRAHMQPGDKVIVMGHPHRASIYRHYIGRVDYVFSEKKEKLYWRRDGRVIHYMTGSDVIEDFETIKRMVAAPREHRLWLLGDRPLLGPGVKTYSPETRATVSEWLAAGNPRCEGEDGATFCVAL